MKRKDCVARVKQMREYLHQEQQELANLLSADSDELYASPPNIDSLLVNCMAFQSELFYNDCPYSRYPQRTSEGWPIKSIATKVCLALVIPVLLLIVYLFGAIGGITGQPFPWFHTPKIYF